MTPQERVLELGDVGSETPEPPCHYGCTEGWVEGVEVREGVGRQQEGLTVNSYCFDTVLFFMQCLYLFK